MPASCACRNIQRFRSDPNERAARPTRSDVIAETIVEPVVSDSELARRIATRREPDRDAEAALCRRFAPRIRHYGIRHLGNSAAALDLVQEVLIVLIEALRAGRIADLDRVDRFVLGTCRNLVLKSYRSERRGQAAKNKLAAVEEYVEERVPLDRTKLSIHLGMLPAREQHVLLLSYRDEQTADEIARLLGTTAGNVRVIRHRALATLERCLTEGEK
jgi:RNA polymerase sigma-70 factor (ECF subfamily)